MIKSKHVYFKMSQQGVAKFFFTIKVVSPWHTMVDFITIFYIGSINAVFL